MKEENTNFVFRYLRCILFNLSVQLTLGEIRPDVQRPSGGVEFVERAVEQLTLSSCPFATLIIPELFQIRFEVRENLENVKNWNFSD